MPEKDSTCNSESVTTQEPFLVRASATRVLGEYNHAFEIRDGDEFVILYGPNGVGKTRFLEVIDALSRLRGSALLLLPFETATLEYSDGSELAAERISGTNKDETQFRGTVAIALRKAGRMVVSWTYGEDEFTKWVRGALPYRQISEDLWEDPGDGEIVHVDELRDRYGRRGPDGNPTPDALKKFAGKVPSYLIETQRLRIEQETRPRPGGFRSISATRGQRRPQSRITEQAENCNNSSMRRRPSIRASRSALTEHFLIACWAQRRRT